MLAQDFGPVRLIMPTGSKAAVWRKMLVIVKDNPETDPVDALSVRATWAAAAAAALSADTDSEGRPQTWGDQARGKDPVAVQKDAAILAAALGGLEERGASLAQIAALGDEIVSWLTAQILAPVEAGEKTAGFFARRKAG